VIGTGTFLMLCRGAPEQRLTLLFKRLRIGIDFPTFTFLQVSIYLETKV